MILCPTTHQLDGCRQKGPATLHDLDVKGANGGTLNCDMAQWGVRLAPNGTPHTMINPNAWSGFAKFTSHVQEIVCGGPGPSIGTHPH